MARFLVRSPGKRQPIALAGLLGAAFILLASHISSVYATSYTSTFTGYAYGNEYGASGYIMTQGDFANHSNYFCPNDPAAYWSFGKNIYMDTPSSITTYWSDGSSYARTAFLLNDIGDPNCDMPNYWVDIYFGNYATPSEYNNDCPCEGSPTPGHCSSTQHSNCQDARNFGSNPNYQYHD